MITTLAFAFLFLLADTNFTASADTGESLSSKDTIRYYDGQQFDIIGKFHDEKNYVRFPKKYESTLRKEVWNLGQHSAGLAIRFRTNSPTIIVRWTVMKDAVLQHMPATGVKGVDLYAFTGNQWQYVRTGIPKGKTSEQILLARGDGISREYLLNLPLYDGVESLEIGVNEDAEISSAKDPYLMDKHPVVYYGTSITQGACASRPGMAFTSLLARKLDRSFINLGFSGNGRIETAVGEAMCEVNAALFVIDCNPNTSEELIYDRTVELVHLLKKQKPEVPVLLIEGFLNEANYFNPVGGVNKSVVKKQQELKRAFDTLKKSGVKNIFYQNGGNLIGQDHEGTVDGIHPNDAGMMRIADVLYPVIKKIL